MTVPLLWVNVPLLLQLPATFIVAAGGPISVPEIITLLNEFTEAPLMVVVPSKVTEPVPELKVPELFQLPFTLKATPLPELSVPIIVRLLAVAVASTVTVCPAKIVIDFALLVGTKGDNAQPVMPSADLSQFAATLQLPVLFER